MLRSRELGAVGAHLDPESGQPRVHGVEGVDGPRRAVEGRT